MRRLVVGVVVVGRHGELPFVGSAAPIAAFMATKGGGRTGPAPPSAATAAGAQRRMAGAGYFASRCKAPLWGATENSRRAAIAGPDRLPHRSPSQEGRGRGPLRQQEKHRRSDGASSRRAYRASSPVPVSTLVAQEPGHVLRGELDAQRCPQRVEAEVRADPR